MSKPEQSAVPTCPTWNDAKIIPAPKGQWCIVVIDGVVQGIAARLDVEDRWQWSDEYSDSTPKEAVTHWQLLPSFERGVAGETAPPDEQVHSVGVVYGSAAASVSAPHKFRKKPVVIEAIQWNGSDINSLQSFTGTDISWSPLTQAAFIPTLEGLMRAESGDWIIKGVKGEFYPCKHDIFAATYEPVEG